MASRVTASTERNAVNTSKSRPCCCLCVCETPACHCAKCPLSCENMALTRPHCHMNRPSLTSTCTRCYGDCVEHARMQSHHRHRALRRFPDTERLWSLLHHDVIDLPRCLAGPVDTEGGSGDVGRPQPGYAGRGWRWRNRGTADVSDWMNKAIYILYIFIFTPLTRQKPDFGLDHI